MELMFLRPARTLSISTVRVTQVTPVHHCGSGRTNFNPKITLRKASKSRSNTAPENQLINDYYSTHPPTDRRCLPNSPLDTASQTDRLNSSLVTLSIAIETEKPTEGSKKLVKDIDIRWLNTDRMCTSVLNNKACIINVISNLGENDLLLSNSQWADLVAYVNLFKHFREATEGLSTRKSSTINIVLLHRTNLIDKLKSFALPNHPDSNFNLKLVQKFEWRFPMEED